MSAIDTVPLLAVVLVTAAGVSALPWTRREVAESVRAFGTLGGLVAAVVSRVVRGLNVRLLDPAPQTFRR